MKPWRICLFFCLVLFFIFLLSLISDEDVILLSGGQKLRMPVFAQFVNSWQRSNVQNNQISSLPKENDICSVPENEQQEETSTNSVKRSLLSDTTVPENTRHTSYKQVSVSQMPQAAVQTKTTVPTGKNGVQAIEYPPDNAQCLYPFFKALKSLDDGNSLIRILHYGDSQIEGDRVTSFLRNELQKRFGGLGNGLFFVKEMIHNNVSIQLLLSKNWITYGLRGVRQMPKSFNRYGVMMTFARFNDFSDYVNHPGALYEASMHIKKQPFSYALSKHFKVFKIYYGYNKKPFLVQMINAGIPLEAEIIPPTDNIQILEWHFDMTPDEFSVFFQGEDSPNVYAVAMDNVSGIAVDNIPLCGSSGLEFARNDPVFFADMYNTLNVKLVILQIGVNVVPRVLSDYSFYENQLVKQLLFLKNIHPDLSILLVGVSDMSRKVGERYESYPNIEKIREAQRRAAFRTGCAFWDTYAAMGGKNSMQKWVFSTPPLAQKDFVHFTYAGSKYIAEMIAKAIINDYNDYLYSTP